ncbi:MAG TPA: AI-2E family transporter [Pyrinomonadaceae bacterium]|nr:AI-2E family transporter [Pyrinomonadaceae bacterium]
MGNQSNEFTAPIRSDQPALRDIDHSWPPIRVILRVILVILTVGGVLVVLLKLTSIILLVVLSIFFAYLVAPLVEVLHRPIYVKGRRLIIPRVGAIALAYLLILVGILGVIYFIVPQLVNQFPQFSEQAQSYGKAFSSRTQQFNQYLTQHRMPASIVDAINNAVPGMVEKIGETATFVLSTIASWVVFIPWLVLIPILSFFLLKDANSFRRSALQMLPRGRWRWRGDEFFQDVNSTLAAYIRAQLTASLFIGAVCAGGFAVMGLPSPLVLGLIAGLFEFVPMLGPVLIGIIAALIAVFHSGLTSALIVLIFLGVLRIVQDYIVYPKLIGHGIHLHPLAIILAILCGEKLAGVAGVFLAIPVVAVATVSYRHWMEHRGSEGLADLLEPDSDATNETPPIVPLAQTVAVDSSVAVVQHPTSHTTPAEMARERPDLTTGELQLPEDVEEE